MICERLRECCDNERFVCADKEKCIFYRDFRRQAVCTEKKKRYNLVNDKNNQVALFHMDGGIIRDEPSVQRCDFLYVVYDQDCPTAIFVELKGSDISHAVRQLKASIDRYGEILKRRVCARIICSSVPRLYNDPIVKNLKRELTRQYQGGNLIIFEKSRDERYSDV